MKKTILLSLLLLAATALNAAPKTDDTGWKPSPNNARKADHIYFDTAEGQQWRMCNIAEAGQAEKISQPGFNDSDWLNARIPATVLTNLVENGKLPDP